MNRNHERLIGQWPTKAWVFSWKAGQQVRTSDGEEIYEIVAVNQQDHVVSIQKRVLGARRRPLPGLREGRPFFARAERDAIRVGPGKWARLIEEGERC
jgi:hypothetical protein